MQDDGGLLPDIAAQAREAALEALIRHRDAGAPPAPEPSPEALHQMIEFMVGPATAEWLPVLEEELALAESDPRAPTWRKADVAPEATFRVAIVGAGIDRKSTRLNSSH